VHKTRMPKNDRGDNGCFKKKITGSHCFGLNSSTRPQQSSLKIKMESLTVKFHASKLQLNCLSDLRNQGLGI
jgi:hypothetical protein